jgi:hypothetical protein
MGSRGCPSVKTLPDVECGGVSKPRHELSTGCIGSKTPRRRAEMSMMTRHKGFWISMEKRVIATARDGSTASRLRVRIGKNGNARVLETLWADQDEEGLSLAVAWIGKQVAA